MRIDPSESALLCLVIQPHQFPVSGLNPLSEYGNLENVSLPAAASVESTESWDSAPRGDVDEEVENFMIVKSPVAFRPPPSRATRQSVSRQSVHSVSGDPLVELMSRMVESSQQET